MRWVHRLGTMMRTCAPIGACLSVLFAIAATAQDAGTQPPGLSHDMPVFRSESRQILVGAHVWKKGQKLDPARVAELEREGVFWKKGLPEGTQIEIAGPQSAKGLGAKDFHIFDNGAEQKPNFFKETAFGDRGINGWVFSPSPTGSWGTFTAGVVFGGSWYLIGYVPPPLAPGECHDITATVSVGDVHLNRRRYCNSPSSEQLNRAIASGTRLGDAMRAFSVSKKHGSIDVKAKAFAFRSFGSLHFGRAASAVQRVDMAGPSPEFKFSIDVFDTKAPARVEIAVDFAPQSIVWNSDGEGPYGPERAHLSLAVLGLVYNEKGLLVREFGEVYAPEVVARTYTPSGRRIRNEDPTVSIPSNPSRYDTQVNLSPGDYEIRLVLTDGNKNFGRAHVPLRIDAINAGQLSISDVVLSHLFRPSSALAQEAAFISPASIVPTPLVSRDVQFFPAANMGFERRKPAAVYFEIYEPLLEAEAPVVSIDMRIVDQVKGETTNIGPIRADKWVQAGSAVIPVAVELAINKLRKGAYTLEVRASDSAGRETSWRKADFTVK